MVKKKNKFEFVWLWLNFFFYWLDLFVNGLLGFFMEINLIIWIWEGEIRKIYYYLKKKLNWEWVVFKFYIFNYILEVMID